jgi:hypothetical protein
MYGLSEVTSRGGSRIAYTANAQGVVSVDALAPLTEYVRNGQVDDTTDPRQSNDTPQYADGKNHSRRSKPGLQPVTLNPAGCLKSQPVSRCRSVCFRRFPTLSNGRDRVLRLPSSAPAMGPFSPRSSVGSLRFSVSPIGELRATRYSQGGRTAQEYKVH